MNEQALTPNDLNWHRYYPMFRGQAPGELWINPWANTADQIRRYAAKPSTLPAGRTYYQHYLGRDPANQSEIITVSKSGRELEHWASQGSTNWSVYYVFPSSGLTYENPVTPSVLDAFASCTPGYFEAVHKKNPEFWNSWFANPANHSPRILRLPPDTNNVPAPGNYVCRINFKSYKQRYETEDGAANIDWEDSGPWAINSVQLKSELRGPSQEKWRTLENTQWRYLHPLSTPSAFMEQTKRTNCTNGCWWLWHSESYVLREVTPETECWGPGCNHVAKPPAFVDYLCFSRNQTGTPAGTGSRCTLTNTQKFPRYYDNNLGDARLTF